MPHVNWSVLDHKNFDFIIRYEYLQEDFSEVLKMLNLEQVRPIPLINPTKKDDSDMLSSLTESELERLRWVAAPLMDYCNYPSLAGKKHNISFSNALAFKVMCFIKETYWRHVRHLT